MSNEIPGSLQKIENQTCVQELLLHDKRDHSYYKSVYRTANILRCMINGINSVTEIASICKLHKSTVSRLLKALEESGLALQNPINHYYYIGPLISEIASNPHLTHERLIISSVGEMRRLANMSGESIALHILMGMHSILLYEVGSIYDFALISKKKINHNIHAGASSKALLSLYNDADLKIVMHNLEFRPLTERTITDKEHLYAQIKQIRREGYSTSYGEINQGGLNIAVPIENYLVPASLGIMGPESRVQPKFDSFINELRISRDRIIENLRLT